MHTPSIHTAGEMKWVEKNMDATDVKARKLLTMQGNLHPISNVHQTERRKIALGECESHNNQKYINKRN